MARDRESAVCVAALPASLSVMGWMARQETTEKTSCFNSWPYMMEVKQVSVVPIESNFTTTKEWVLTDGSEIIKGDFGTEILCEDVVIIIQRSSAFFSPEHEHGYILSGDYEAPMILGEEGDWSSATFVRVQRLSINDELCSSSTPLDKFLKESAIEMIYKTEDATFLIRKVNVRIQIKPLKNIKSIEPYVIIDENGEWQSGFEVKYEGDRNKVRYNVTSYNDSIKGRLLLGRGVKDQDSNRHRPKKEVYRGVLVNNQKRQNEVVLKILKCKLKKNWKSEGQGITLQDLEIDDLGGSIVDEIKIMQEIKSRLPNGEHPHLALDVTGIYTTVSDTQRGHLLVAFPYQTNSSLLSFLHSKLFKTCRSEEKIKIIRFLLKDTAMGLQPLHENGVAHVDLTVENIVVDAQCRCKLIDFGLTRKTNESVRLKDLNCKPDYYNPFHLILFKDSIEDVILQGEMLKMVDIWNLSIIMESLLNDVNVPDWEKRKAPLWEPRLKATLDENAKTILRRVANRERILKSKLEWERAKHEGLGWAVTLLECEHARRSANSEDMEGAVALLDLKRSRKLSNKCEDLESAVALLKSERSMLLDKRQDLKSEAALNNLDMTLTFLEDAKRAHEYNGLKLAVALLEKLAKRSDKYQDREMAENVLEYVKHDKFDSLEKAIAALKGVVECEDLELAETLWEWENAERPDNYKDGLKVAMALLRWERAKCFGGEWEDEDNHSQELSLLQWEREKCLGREWEGEEPRDNLSQALSLLQWEREKCSHMCESLELVMALREWKVVECRDDHNNCLMTDKSITMREILEHPCMKSLKDDERSTVFSLWAVDSSEREAVPKRSRTPDSEEGYETTQETYTVSKCSKNA